MVEVTRRRLGLGLGLGLGAGLGGGFAATAGAAAARDEDGSSAVVRSGFIYDQAPYPQCHASTIVETKGGVMAAAWFGGTHEKHPDVCIWFARFENGAWTEGVQLADGVQPDGSRHPTWNPVLFQPPQGDLILFYKVGPDPFNWWGMVMTSPDGGRTWSAPRRLPDGILGPIKNKPVVLADGTWLSPSSTEAGEGMGSAAGANWRLHFEISTDQGRHWTLTDPVGSPLNIDAIQPSVLVHPNGALQAVARARQGALASSWSHDGGRTWSPIGAVDLPNPNSGTDASTLSDGRHLMIYNHAGHEPARPGRGPRYPLNVGLSADGLSWRNVLTLESEALPHGYAYPAVVQASDGLVHVTYTHDRTRIRHVILDPSRLT
ncbi:sialidase family protein [Brevundimonas sp. NPDC058933]|uniref:sialidase family protein n=1 Tax=Brevundimonas sp. NPDC058933 TaxID=3346673 RepID=UPI003BEEE697